MYSPVCVYIIMIYFNIYCKIYQFNFSFDVKITLYKVLDAVWTYNDSKLSRGKQIT